MLSDEPPGPETCRLARLEEQARQAAWLGPAERLIASFKEHRARSLRDSVTCAQFDRLTVKGGPAIGVQTRSTWRSFVELLAGPRWERDSKDGPCFVPSRFEPYYSGDASRVRRQRRYVIARTLVALDVETCRASGEVPPAPTEAAERVQAAGLGGVIYTSHSHSPAEPRYRVVLPLAREIPYDHELPVVEVVAERLGLLAVLDLSKLSGESAFYLPSCPVGAIGQHQCLVAAGEPIDPDWLAAAAGALLAARRAGADRIAAAAHEAAQARLAARQAAGFDADDGVIEKIRARLDLGEVLRVHGYAQQARQGRAVFRHPGSQSGCFGASIKKLGGVDRVFSHNGGDPLHVANLPDWCSVQAVDAFDVVAVLDFGGDRSRAIRELTGRFNLDKAPAKRAVAALLYRRIRENAPQGLIERDAFLAGQRRGLSNQEVCGVARWFVRQLAGKKTA